MAPEELTRLWIQYLKNNHIVSNQSDPKTGQLSYIRKVGADDIIEFLKLKTDFSDKDIKKAISSVKGSNSADNTAPPSGTSSELSTDAGLANNQQSQQKMPANAPSTASQPTNNAQRTKKYDTSNATDVEPRYGPRAALPYQNDAPTSSDNTPPQIPHSPSSKSEEPPTATTIPPGKQDSKLSQTPGAVRKREQRAEVSKKQKAAKSAFSQMAGSLSKKPVNEDFRDNLGRAFNEKDIEEIFKFLTSKQASPAGSEDSSKKSSQDPSVYRQKEIAQIKKVIRDSMNDQQRMSLWRALNDQ